MDVTGFFDRIRIINLPERADRRWAMEKHLAESGLAVDAGRCAFHPGVRPPEAGEFPSVGARGCFLSHLGVLKEALEDGAGNVLVMEDDLAISPGFREAQGRLLEQLSREEWDFAYFGHAIDVPHEGPPSFVRYDGAVLLTHFCAVNGRVLERLVAFLELILTRPAGHPEAGPMHVDGAFSTFRELNPDVVTLLAAPSMGWQRSSRSDIADNAWYDRVPVLRPLLAWARKGKETLRGRG